MTRIGKSELFEMRARLALSAVWIESYRVLTEWCVMTIMCDNAGCTLNTSTALVEHGDVSCA